MKINSKQIMWQTYSKPWGNTIADWLHSLSAYSNPVKVLQRPSALCKELIKMSHRFSAMNLANVWEESGSNNTLDCINTKSFILLICDCFFEHRLLCVFL